MSSYYIAAKSALVEFFDELEPHIDIYHVTGVTVHTTQGDVKIPVFEYAEVEDA